MSVLNEIRSMVKSAQVPTIRAKLKNPEWNSKKGKIIGGPYLTFYNNTNKPAIKLDEYAVRRPGGNISGAIVNIPRNPNLTPEDCARIGSYLAQNHKKELGGMTASDIAKGIYAHTLWERVPFAGSHLGMYDINYPNDPFGERIPATIGMVGMGLHGSLHVNPNDFRTQESTAEATKRILNNDDLRRLGMLLNPDKK